MNYDNDPEPRDRPLRIVELMAVIGRLRAQLATVTAERDSLRSTRRKLHDALTLAHEQHSELCREFHAERAAWLVEKLNARGANVT